MLSFTIGFVIRTLATALLIVIVARLAERTGPFVASTVLTLPLFAGPSYFFMLSDVSPDFLALSALYAFAGTGAVLAFTAGYIAAVPRVGLALSLVAGSCAWLTVAAPYSISTARWTDRGRLVFSGGSASVVYSPHFGLTQSSR